MAGRRAGVRARKRIRLLPGADPLRVVIVALLAALALLSLVGAAVMFMFWLEANDGTLTTQQSVRAWEALDALHGLARVVAFACLAAVTIWTFVAVFNVRRVSGRRRNPLLAALAWPAAVAGVWWCADRLIDRPIADQPVGPVIAGFVGQAAVLAVPFVLLQRSAASIGSRSTPIRVTYALGVVLLIHSQALAGLSTIQQTGEVAEYARLTGYLALGALVTLISTMAVSAACASMTRAAEHGVEQRDVLAAQSAARPRLAAPDAAVVP